MDPNARLAVLSPAAKFPSDMLTLAFIALHAVIGIAAGLTYRALAARSQLGFKLQHWALLGMAIGCALLFARFVINRRGLFGTQPENALFVGTLLMVGGFLLVTWLLPWLRRRRP